MQIRTGIDRLVDDEFQQLKGKNVGLVCNQGSIDRGFQYTFDLFRQAHGKGIFRLKSIFGPQHGLFGHTQDNMIEWSGGQIDPITRSSIYSLYGEVRKPTSEMLSGIDVLVVDLIDIGARYYTFIWTMKLCMEACEELGIALMVLDRPNPLGGIVRESTVIQSGFESFVGLAPLPMRHGYTIGELALYFKHSYYPNAEVEVIPVEGWTREQMAFDFPTAWSMPSPNMPTIDSALVYPGMCLLEGTTLSEGRGTTHPFEIFGAPWLDAWTFTEHLNQQNLPGVYFRPIEFQPTFQKHQGKLCYGAFIHVLNRQLFQSVSTSIAIMLESFRVCSDHLFWKEPPYEYEFEKLPIDILAGNEWLRIAIESQASLEAIMGRMEAELAEFRREFRLQTLY